MFHERASLGIGGITIEDLEYIREGADQHFGRLALALTNQRKFLFGACLEQRDTFAQHLGQVVAAQFGPRTAAQARTLRECLPSDYTCITKSTAVSSSRLIVQPPKISIGAVRAPNTATNP